MEFQVRKDLLKDAEQCRNNFSCLLGQEECFCPVEEDMDGRILFVTPPNSNVCEYMMSFGYSYLCKCPVRKEIYNKYKK